MKRYEAVKRLLRQFLTVRQIAKRLGLPRADVSDMAELAYSQGLQVFRSKGTMKFARLGKDGQVAEWITYGTVSGLCIEPMSPPRRRADTIILDDVGPAPWPPSAGVPPPSV